MNYYNVLGVDKNASAAAIKVKYREHAMNLHPDRNSNDPDDVKLEKANKFKAITEAYRILSDPVKRKELDDTNDKGYYNQKTYTKAQYSKRASPKTEKPWSETGYGSGGGAGMNPQWDFKTWERYHYGDKAPHNLSNPHNLGNTPNPPPGPRATYKEQLQYDLEEKRRVLDRHFEAERESFKGDGMSQSHKDAHSTRMRNASYFMKQERKFLMEEAEHLEAMHRSSRGANKGVPGLGLTLGFLGGACLCIYLLTKDTKKKK